MTQSSGTARRVGDVEAEVRNVARRVAASLALAAAHLAAGPHAVEAASPPPGEPVPFETLAIVAGTTGINLVEGHSLRIASPDDVEPVRALLNAGNYDDTLAREAVAAVGDV